MDEQEILSRLKAQVARHQIVSSEDQRPTQLRVEASDIDVSRIDGLSAQVQASRDAVEQINPRAPESPVEDSKIDVSNLDRLSAQVQASRDALEQINPRTPGFPVEASNADVSNFDRLITELWASRDAVGQVNPRNPGFLNEIAQRVKRKIRRSLSWYTRSLQAFHHNVVLALQADGSAIKSIAQSLGQIQNRLLSLDRLHQVVNNEALALQAQGGAIKSIAHSLKELEDQLLQWQNGRPAEVLLESLRAVDLATQEQQIPYVELFRGLSPVVDIGCGRGEFLELLKERGIEGYGVDSDRFACDEARRKLVTVVHNDLFEHLRQLPDRSLGGIFSARVVEYLPTHLQVEFISLSSQKMKRRGLIVIETMNPESTSGFGRNSHLDLTHLRAVPAEMLKSALESNSFQDIKICFLAPIEGCAAPVSESSNSPERSGRILPGACNSLLRAPAYAAVGWRS